MKKTSKVQDPDLEPSLPIEISGGASFLGGDGVMCAKFTPIRSV
jgi:hypothetical protein